MQYSDYLYHHGIKGQKWGIRRFQNSDGTYTEAGKKRYHLSDKQKNAIKIGAAVVGTALLAYGGYKFGNSSAGKSIVSKVFDKHNCSVENISKESISAKDIISRANELAGRGMVTKASSNGRVLKTDNQPKAKDLSEFKWHAATRMAADGSTSRVLLPDDEKGYVHTMATKMATNANGSVNKSDYDYWQRYFKNRLKYSG